MKAIIGPNGKDVYVIAIFYGKDGQNHLTATMVEALSKDEALGIGYRMAKDIFNPMIFVTSNFGPFNVATMKFEDYGKK